MELTDSAAVALGALVGAALGARVQARLQASRARLVTGAILLVVAAVVIGRTL